MEFSNKKERRDFLKKMGFGSAGLGLAIAGLSTSDPVLARLESKITHDHVSSFIEKIRSSNPSKESEKAFIQTYNNFLKLLLHDKNKDAIRILNSVKEYIKKANKESMGIYTPSLPDLPLTTSNMLAGSYLATTHGLEFGAYGENELRRALPKIKNIPLEQNFIINFSKKINNEISIDNKLSNKIFDFGHPILNQIKELQLLPQTQAKFGFVLTLIWDDPPLWAQITVAVIIIASFIAGVGAIC